MGRLIYFEDHHPGVERGGPVRRMQGESLVPLQLALNEYNIEKCFAQLTGFGRCSVFPRANPSDSGKILFLIRIRDAIELNRHLLEEEGDDSQAAVNRMDHIQMLENCEESLLSKAWDRIGLETSVRFTSGSGSVNHIRQ